MKQIGFISLGILLFVARQASAGWFGADFSADIYQGTAQSLSRQGHMAVSQGRVRTEMDRDGHKLIEIIDPAKGKAWLLNPQVKQYMVRDVPHTPSQAGTPESPCDHLPQGVLCRPLGAEAVNGRNSTKWQIQGGGHSQLLWLDAEHHFPVRVVNDGKLAMEMRFLGRENVASRITEKWQSQMTGPQGLVTATQWYDPQLNIAIRQLLADGQVRELRNIHVGSQQEQQFTVPSDYQRQLPQTTNNN